METVNYNIQQIGEIVAHDFRTAQVFKSKNIDFCCGGKKTLEQVCNEKGLDPNEIGLLLEDIAKLPMNTANDFKNWKLDFLCDYVVNTHHAYVTKTLPDLLFYTQKIADVHGDRHSELKEVSSLFAKIHDELLQHLKNEEEVLFPAIKSALANKDILSKNTIVSEITHISAEHEFAGSAMDQINQITQHYRLPEDSCSTYQVTFKLLEQFEDDLHIHVHLENNILYPNALKLTV